MNHWPTRQTTVPACLRFTSLSSGGHFHSLTAKANTFISIRAQPQDFSFAATLMEICHGRFVETPGAGPGAGSRSAVWHRPRPRSTSGITWDPALAPTQAAKRCFTRCLVERKTEAQTWKFFFFSPASSYFSR